MDEVLDGVIVKEFNFRGQLIRAGEGEQLQLSDCGSWIASIRLVDQREICRWNVDSTEVYFILWENPPLPDELPL